MSLGKLCFSGAVLSLAFLIGGSAGGALAQAQDLEDICSGYEVATKLENGSRATNYVYVAPSDDRDPSADPSWPAVTSNGTSQPGTGNLETSAADTSTQRDSALCVAMAGDSSAIEVAAAPRSHPILDSSGNPVLDSDGNPTYLYPESATDLAAVSASGVSGSVIAAVYGGSIRWVEADRTGFAGRADPGRHSTILASRTRLDSSNPVATAEAIYRRGSKPAIDATAYPTAATSIGEQDFPALMVTGSGVWQQAAGRGPTESAGDLNERFTLRGAVALNAHPGAASAEITNGVFMFGCIGADGSSLNVTTLPAANPGAGEASPSTPCHGAYGKVAEARAADGNARVVVSNSEITLNRAGYGGDIFGLAADAALYADASGKTLDSGAYLAIDEGLASGGSVIRTAGDGSFAVHGAHLVARDTVSPAPGHMSRIEAVIGSSVEVIGSSGERTAAQTRILTTTFGSHGIHAVMRSSVGGDRSRRGGMSITVQNASIETRGVQSHAINLERDIPSTVAHTGAIEVDEGRRAVIRINKGTTIKTPASGGVFLNVAGQGVDLVIGESASGRTGAVSVTGDIILSDQTIQHTLGSATLTQRGFSDSIVINGGNDGSDEPRGVSLAGDIRMGGGDDSLEMHAPVAGAIDAGAGDDLVLFGAGSGIPSGTVSMGTGADTVVFDSGSDLADVAANPVAVTVNMGDEADTLVFRAGSYDFGTPGGSDSVTVNLGNSPSASNRDRVIVAGVAGGAVKENADGTTTAADATVLPGFSYTTGRKPELLLCGGFSASTRMCDGPGAAGTGGFNFALTPASTLDVFSVRVLSSPSDEQSVVSVQQSVVLEDSFFHDVRFSADGATGDTLQIAGAYSLTTPILSLGRRGQDGAVFELDAKTDGTVASDKLDFTSNAVGSPPPAAPGAVDLFPEMAFSPTVVVKPIATTTAATAGQRLNLVTARSRSGVAGVIYPDADPVDGTVSMNGGAWLPGSSSSTGVTTHYLEHQTFTSLTLTGGNGQVGSTGGTLALVTGTFTGTYTGATSPDHIFLIPGSTFGGASFDLSTGGSDRVYGAGTVTTAITMGAGNDLIGSFNEGETGSNSLALGSVDLGGGDNFMRAKSVALSISAGSGNDTLIISESVRGNVILGAGRNLMTVKGELGATDSDTDVTSEGVRTESRVLSGAQTDNTSPCFINPLGVDASGAPCHTGTATIIHNNADRFHVSKVLARASIDMGDGDNVLTVETSMNGAYTGGSGTDLIYLWASEDSAPDLTLELSNNIMFVGGQHTSGITAAAGKTSIDLSDGSSGITSDTLFLCNSRGLSASRHLLSYSVSTGGSALYTFADIPGCGGSDTRPAAYYVELDASSSNTWDMIRVVNPDLEAPNSKLAIKGNVALFRPEFNEVTIAADGSAGDTITVRGSYEMLAGSEVPMADRGTNDITIHKGTVFELDVGTAASSAVFPSDKLVFEASATKAGGALPRHVTVPTIKIIQADGAGGALVTPANGDKIEIVEVKTGSDISGVEILGASGKWVTLRETSAAQGVWELKSADVTGGKDYFLEYSVPVVKLINDSYANGDLAFGAGRDDVTITKVAWVGGITDSAGEADLVRVGATATDAGGDSKTWSLGGGNDMVTGSGAVTAALSMGAGDDRIGDAALGAADAANMLTLGTVDLGEGDNYVRALEIASGDLFAQGGGSLRAGSGNDSVTISGHASGRTPADDEDAAPPVIDLGGGFNTLAVAGKVTGDISVAGSAGNLLDLKQVEGAIKSANHSELNGDTVRAAGISGSVDLGHGTNTLEMEYAKLLDASLAPQADGTLYEFTYKGGSGDDHITLTSGVSARLAAIEPGGGSNRIFVKGAEGELATAPISLDLSGARANTAGSGAGNADEIVLCAAEVDESSGATCTDTPRNVGYYVVLDATGSVGNTWETIKVDNQTAGIQSRIAVRGSLTLSGAEFWNARLESDGAETGDVLTVTGGYSIETPTGTGQNAGTGGTLFVLDVDETAGDKLVFDARAEAATGSAKVPMVSLRVDDTAVSGLVQDGLVINVAEIHKDSGVERVDILEATGDQGSQVVRLFGYDWQYGKIDADSANNQTPYDIYYISAPAELDQTVIITGQGRTAGSIDLGGGEHHVTIAGSWAGNYTGGSGDDTIIINSGVNSTGQTWLLGVKNNAIECQNNAKKCDSNVIQRDSDTSSILPGTIYNAVTMGDGNDEIGILDPAGPDGILTNTSQNPNAEDDNPSQAEIDAAANLDFRGGAVDLGGGNNRMRAQVSQAIAGGAGNDEIEIKDTVSGDVSLGGGTNSLRARELAGSYIGGSGPDTVIVAGDVTEGVSLGGGDGNVAEIGGFVGGEVTFTAGDGSQVTAGIVSVGAGAGAGKDMVTVDSVARSVSLGDGENELVVQRLIGGSYFGGAGVDRITLSRGASLSGSETVTLGSAGQEVVLMDGNDVLRGEGAVAAHVKMGAGNDRIGGEENEASLNMLALDGGADLGDGSNTVRAASAGDLAGGAGDDMIFLAGGAGDLSLGDGNNTVRAASAGVITAGGAAGEVDDIILAGDSKGVSLGGGSINNLEVQGEIDGAVMCPVDGGQPVQASVCSGATGPGESVFKLADVSGAIMLGSGNDSLAMRPTKGAGHWEVSLGGGNNTLTATLVAETDPGNPASELAASLMGGTGDDDVFLDIGPGGNVNLSTLNLGGGINRLWVSGSSDSQASRKLTLDLSDTLGSDILYICSEGPNPFGGCAQDPDPDKEFAFSAVLDATSGNEWERIEVHNESGSLRSLLEIKGHADSSPDKIELFNSKLNNIEISTDSEITVAASEVETPGDLGDSGTVFSLEMGIANGAPTLGKVIFKETGPSASPPAGIPGIEIRYAGTGADLEALGLADADNDGVANDSVVIDIAETYSGSGIQEIKILHEGAANVNFLPLREDYLSIGGVFWLLSKEEVVETAPSGAREKTRHFLEFFNGTVHQIAVADNDPANPSPPEVLDITAAAETEVKVFVSHNWNGAYEDTPADTIDEIFVDLGAWRDRTTNEVTTYEVRLGGDIALAGGNDVVSGRGVIAGDLDLGAGDDAIGRNPKPPGKDPLTSAEIARFNGLVLDNGLATKNTVSLGDGDDSVWAVSLGANMTGGSGGKTIRIERGVTGNVDLGQDANEEGTTNNVEAGGDWTANYAGGIGADVVSIGGSAEGKFALFGGENSLVVERSLTGGAAPDDSLCGMNIGNDGCAVSGGAGNDTVSVGGDASGAFYLGGGDNKLSVEGTLSGVYYRSDGCHNIANDVNCGDDGANTIEMRYTGAEAKGLTGIEVSRGKNRVLVAGREGAISSEALPLSYWITGVDKDRANFIEKAPDSATGSVIDSVIEICNGRFDDDGACAPDPAYAQRLVLDTRVPTRDPPIRQSEEAWTVKLSSHAEGIHQSALRVKGKVSLESPQFGNFRLEGDGEAGDTLTVTGDYVIVNPTFSGSVLRNGTSFAVDATLGVASSSDKLVFEDRSTESSSSSRPFVRVNIMESDPPASQPELELVIFAARPRRPNPSHDGNDPNSMEFLVGSGISEIEVFGVEKEGEPPKRQIDNTLTLNGLNWNLERELICGALESKDEDICAPGAEGDAEWIRWSLIGEENFTSGECGIDNTDTCDMGKGRNSLVIDSDWEYNYRGGSGVDTITVSSPATASGQSFQLGSGNNVIKGNGTIQAEITMGGGHDTIGDFVTLSDADNSLFLDGPVDLGDGDNKVRARRALRITGGSGSDTITLTDGVIASVFDLKGGDNSVTAQSISSGGSIIGGSGEDVVRLTGHSTGILNLGDGAATVDIGGNVTGNDIEFGYGQTDVAIGGNLGANISMRIAASDPQPKRLAVKGVIESEVTGVQSQPGGIFRVFAGGSSSEAEVRLGDGENWLTVTKDPGNPESGYWRGTYVDGAGVDTVTVEAGAVVSSALRLTSAAAGGEGNAIRGAGEIHSTVEFGDGNDIVGDESSGLSASERERLNSLAMTADVNLGGGNNVLRASSVTSLTAGAGNDRVYLRPDRGFSLSKLDLGEGRNSLWILGGSGNPDDRAVTLSLADSGAGQRVNNLHVCSDESCSAGSGGGNTFNVALDGTSGNAWASVQVVNAGSGQSSLKPMGDFTLRNSDFGNMRVSSDGSTGDVLTISGSYSLKPATVFEMDFDPAAKTADKIEFRSATGKTGTGLTRILRIDIKAPPESAATGDYSRVDLVTLESADIEGVRINGQSADHRITINNREWILDTERSSSGSGLTYFVKTGDVALSQGTSLPTIVSSMGSSHKVTGGHILALASGALWSRNLADKGKNSIGGRVGADQDGYAYPTSPFWVRFTVGDEIEEPASGSLSLTKQSFQFINSGADLFVSDSDDGRLTQRLILQFGTAETETARIQSTMTSFGYGVEFRSPTNVYFGAAVTASRISVEKTTVVDGFDAFSVPGSSVSLDFGWDSRVNSALTISPVVRLTYGTLGEFALPDGSVFRDFQSFSGDLGIGFDYARTERSQSGEDLNLGNLYGSVTLSHGFRDAYEFKQLNYAPLSVDSDKTWLYIDAGWSWSVGVGTSFFTEVSSALTSGGDVKSSRQAVTMGYDIAW